MYQIKPLSELHAHEISDMAAHAADCGQHPEQANPFTPGTTKHATFAASFERRVAELGLAGTPA